MVKHEFDSGSEYASPQELAEAYGAIAAWLEYNGEFFVEGPDVIHGQVNGVPISELPPSLQYEIKGDVLRQILPKEAGVLQVGDTLELRHNQEYYAYMGDDGQPDLLMEPAVQFGIYKDASSIYTTEDLFITYNSSGILDDEKWRGRRVNELRDFKRSGPLANIASEASSPEAFEWLSTNEEEVSIDAIEAGLDTITRNEFAALLSIAEHLDEIRALQDQSGR